MKKLILSLLLISSGISFVWGQTQGFNADSVYLGKTTPASATTFRSTRLWFPSIPTGSVTPVKFGGFASNGTFVTRSPGQVLTDIGGIGLNALSAISPMAYNPLTGVFSMSEASEILNGYWTNSSQILAGFKTIKASSFRLSSNSPDVIFDITDDSFLRKGYFGYVTSDPSHGIYIRNNVSDKHLRLLDNGIMSYDNSFFVSNLSTTIGQLRLINLLTGGKSWEFQSYTDGALYINNEGQEAVVKLANSKNVNFYGDVILDNYSGFGDRISGIDNIGTVFGITVGSGLSLLNDTLRATGGSAGTVTATGLSAGYIAKGNSTSDIGNSIISEADGSIGIAGNLYLNNSDHTGLYVDAPVGKYSQLILQENNITKWNIYRDFSNGNLVYLSSNGIQSQLSELGDVTFNGDIVADNLSGTNTGDQDLSPYAPLASPALTGNPTAPTQSPGDNSTKIATTAYVDAADALKAPLASPALTGTPTAPTQSPGDNSTKIATTAFVTAAANTAFAYGTYIPTITNGTNVASSLARKCQYSRVGNIVTVSGALSVDPVAGGGTLTLIDVSLPIASVFTSTDEANGQGTALASLMSSIRIRSDVSGKVQFEIVADSAVNADIFYTYQYEIL